MKITLVLSTLLALAVAGADPLTLFAEKRLISPQTVNVPVDLPAVAAGQQVRLSLKARVDTPTFGGHNPFLGVQINGHLVGATQLINKPIEFTCNDGSDAPWIGQDGTWRLLYSPSFDAFFKEDPPQYMVADADPYLFVWDITSFVKPGANTVTLWHPKLLKDPTTCVIGDAQIEVGAPLPPLTAGGAAPSVSAALPVYVPTVPKPVAMEVEIASTSLLRVKVAGRTLEVLTRTSLPDGQWSAGAASPLQKVKGASPVVARSTQTGYAVSRAVTVLADHVHVADTITNTSGKLNGLILRHALQVPAAPAVERLLGGHRVYKTKQTLASPENPTAIALFKEVAVGLVAVDDIFRVHSELFADAASIGLSDNKLGLAPGAAHTLEWDLYPVPRGDYYALINAIRRNWGSNFTIPGPSCIENPAGDKPQADVSRWAVSRCLNFVIAGQQSGDDGELAEGLAIPGANKWNANYRAWKDKLHQAVPPCQALLYLHSQLTTQAKQADLQAKYPDCRVLDAAGNQQVTPYYYPIYLFLPTLDNQYGKDLLQTVQFMLDDLKADGIYNDCFTYDSAAWTWGGPWDGCTVSIDPNTHAVTGQYASVILLQQPWKLQMAKMVRERGKLLCGNGPLPTRSLLQQKIPTFTETNSFSFLVGTHLGAPWGLGTHSSKQDLPTRAYMARRMLDYAGIYSVYAWLDEPQGEQFIKYFFPSTPIELRPGVVICQERILTNRSGRFGWGDASAAEVHVYDDQGQPVARPQVKQVRAGGRVLTEVRLPPNGLAALVRKR